MDSPEVKRAYQIIFSIRITYYAPDGQERDYISLDFEAEMYSLDDSIIKEFLSLKKPSKKLLSSLIDKIVIDEEQNVNIYYKIKPLY